MERSELAHRLFLSTIGSDSRALALEYHLGLELAEFCTARNLDCPAVYSQAQAKSSGISRLWFHAPFAELSPAAIDPMVRAVTRRRYHQSIRAARQLGVTRLVIHTGFVPMVYFPQWFIQQSVLFWRRFLQHTDSILIALENVMEPDPTVQLEIVRQVDDPRLRLCLDIGHANSQVSQTPLAQWIDTLAPWIAHVHLHNNDGGWDLHNPLGQGSIAMEPVLDHLLDACPGATFTIENQSCLASVQWLIQHHYIKKESI